MIYLDNNSTTKLTEDVKKAMDPFFDEKYGNPSSLSTMGLEANFAIQEARNQIAGLIGAKADEIIFTSGGTESDNLALFGIACANKEKGNHIITSTIEHPAIIEPCIFLEKLGFKVDYIKVDKYGLVDPNDVKEAIRDETILISIMTVNNEIGTIQPIKEIGHIAKKKNICFHTDASAAIGQTEINVQEMNIDIISMDSHKIHGPKGVGAIYLKEGTKIQHQIIGGGQERNLRAGTENVPGIVGMGKAFEIVTKNFGKYKDEMTFLRNKLMNGILEIEDVSLNGHPERRAPNNVNMSFKFIDGKSLVLSLNSAGIIVSTGCACTSKSLNASHVLRACGLSEEEAKGTIRLTNSRLNTEDDINHVLETLPGIIKELRSKNSLYKQVIK